MTGTGLKKCMPMKRSGRSVAVASLVIEIDEVLVAITLAGPLIAGRRSGAVPISTPVVLLAKVQNLNHLVTVKYVLEKVVVYDDAKWYGDNRVLFIAHGVAKAGIDLSMLQAGDIQIADKKISVALPPARITDVYLDDHRSEVVERSTGLLRAFDKDLEQNARMQVWEYLREAATKNGVSTDATERAKVELTALLQQLGFTEVEFRGKGV